MIMAGTNDETSTMTFTLASTVSGIGGLINYAPGFGTPMIAVYDSMGNLIDSAILSFSTGGGVNVGEFYGFSESTPIKSFALTGAYIGIADLEVSSVPEFLHLGDDGARLRGIGGRRVPRDPDRPHDIVGSLIAGARLSDQQMRGSCSPASQSTIRPPPKAVRISTKQFSSSTAAPMIEARAPSG